MDAAQPAEGSPGTVEDGDAAELADRPNADEVALVHRVRSGDKDAYADLVRLHAAAAYRVAELLGAGHEAEDVVQVAFVKAYHALTVAPAPQQTGGDLVRRRQASFRPGASFRPWLLRIVANETKNALRAARRRRNATARLAEFEQYTPDPQHDPAAEALSQARRATLLAAVRALPRNQMLVVACRYFLELDEEETATVLNWPRGTVKSRLHRALRRLRRMVEGGGHAD
ncbi:MAG TPA: sigma-70 family RNA polymerase sigma factor [Actinopolymorphaceae bacterium]